MLPGISCFSRRGGDTVYIGHNVFEISYGKGKRERALMLKPAAKASRATKNRVKRSEGGRRIRMGDDLRER